MDVKYTPSEWEQVKEGIGNLIGLGRHGKGIIDILTELSDNLEDTEAAIAQLDCDGAISFQHTSQRSKYKELDEDYRVLHQFAGKVGGIVDGTIDERFLNDMEAFVEAVEKADITKYTTKNRIGAKEIKVEGFGEKQNSFEVSKAKVNIEDLFKTDVFSKQMKLEYEEWKKLHPHQNFSEEDYEQVVLTNHAFTYISFKDKLESKKTFKNYFKSFLLDPIDGQHFRDLFYADIGEGIWDELKSVYSGIEFSVTHPITSITSLYRLTSNNPEDNLYKVQAWKEMKLNSKDYIENSSQARIFGRSLGILGTLFATDAIGAIPKIAKGGEIGGELAKSSEVSEELVEDTSKLVFKNEGDYFDYINNIGKKEGLTSRQKFDMIQEAYQALETKGNVTVLSDIKYLKLEGFNKAGRMVIDWPEKMGFTDNIQPISRINKLPDEWDRIGGMGGENFTTLPLDRNPYSYEQRAIPYLENESARHTGTFNNKIYFDAIDAIKNKDLNMLNEIMTKNGTPKISVVNFDDMVANYYDFQTRALNSVGNIDATYGLKGFAAPWQNSTTGEILLNGGAEQIVTPLSGSQLMDLGVLKKY